VGISGGKKSRKGYSVKETALLDPGVKRKEEQKNKGSGWYLVIRDKEVDNSLTRSHGERGPNSKPLGLPGRGKTGKI